MLKLRILLITVVVCAGLALNVTLARGQSTPTKVESTDAPLVDGGIPPNPTKNLKLMLPLYASMAVAEALDAHSTIVAVDAGARERNPILGVLAPHPTLFSTVKVVATVTLLRAAHQLGKKHPRGAIAAMIGLSAFNTAIAIHNYRVAAAMRRNP
jgi:hypothetical protein